MGQELGPLVNPKMADVYGHVCSCSLPPYGAPLHGQCLDQIGRILPQNASGATDFKSTLQIMGETSLVGGLVAIF